MHVYSYASDLGLSFSYSDLVRNCFLVGFIDVAAVVRNRFNNFLPDLLVDFAGSSSSTLWGLFSSPPPRSGAFSPRPPSPAPGFAALGLFCYSFLAPGPVRGPAPTHASRAVTSDASWGVSSPSTGHRRPSPSAPVPSPSLPFAPVGASSSPSDSVDESPFLSDGRAGADSSQPVVPAASAREFGRVLQFAYVFFPGSRGPAPVPAPRCVFETLYSSSVEREPLSSKFTWFDRVRKSHLDAGKRLSPEMRALKAVSSLFLFRHSVYAVPGNPSKGRAIPLTLSLSALLHVVPANVRSVTISFEEVGGGARVVGSSPF